MNHIDALTLWPRLRAGSTPALNRWAVAAITFSCLMAAGPGWADQAPKETASTNSPVKVRFRPPAAGAPSVRLTGGSRGIGDNTVTLDVLAPEDVGLTTQEQPSLFWYQSKPTTAKFELTLLQEKQVKPLLRINGERAATSGIQRVRLADHGVKLSPGVEYQWVVALISDSANRSTDQIATGVIKRVEPSADLKQKISGASPASLPAVYADAGIWYDALSTLSDRIDAEPTNRSLLETRSDLLRQAGLKGALTAVPVSVNK